MTKTILTFSTITDCSYLFIYIDYFTFHSIYPCSWWSKSVMQENRSSSL